MIVGIGIDIIDIERFADWHTKSEVELLRVFSAEEIAYCLHENKQLSAERFAVRFAAKEAFYKAFSHMNVQELSLLSVQKEVSITHLSNGAPCLVINWDKLLHEKIARPKVNLSLSHAQLQAVAMVILEK